MKIDEGDINGLVAIHKGEQVTLDALGKLSSMGLVHVEATLTSEGRRVLSERLSVARKARVVRGDAEELQNFAASVLAAARSCRTGKWGESKVFVNHAWRAYARLAGQMSFAGHMSLATFKVNLIKAQRQGLLRLSRADLVEAMPAKDVSESVIHSLGATYHFVYKDS